MEQFVCHLYNFPEDKDINEVRCQRFISQIIKKINPETLPSTKNEFFLPMKRSNYEIKDEISIPITPRNTASSRSWLPIRRWKNWSTMDGSAIQWFSHSIHHPWMKLHLVLQFQIIGGALNKRESPTDNLNINKCWVQIKEGSENVPLSSYN